MSGLPKGWVESALETLCISVSDGDHQAPPKASSGVPFITISSIWDGRIDLQNVTRFVPLAYKEALEPSRVPQRGDIVLSVTGSIGRTAIVENPSFVFQRHIALIKTVPQIEQQYLCCFFTSALTVRHLERLATGTAQKTLPLSKLRKVSIPLPPLAEQKRIVAKLDALNAKSARARTELARIETLVSRYKQAVLSKAFSGELTREWRESSGVVLSVSEKLAVGKALQRALSSRRGARTNTHQVDFDAVAAIPNSWAHAVVGVGADMTVGFAFKSEWFRAGGVKLLRGANIAPRAIDWSELKCLDASLAHEFARYLVEENDIVLAMDRPVISTGLKVARVANQDAGCLLVQRVTRFRASEFVAQNFLWWFLNTGKFLAHSLHRATGSDLLHISGDDIATCPLPVPPLNEQHEIVRRIESAFAKIDRLAKEAKRALALVGKLDEAILAKAFRGELVPQDDKDEPAEQLLARIRAERERAPKAKRRRGVKA
ncbi:restriction endonuclease subunit S [Rhizobium sp. YIM 134829]|uniref:restriction endonuclease subunit S n=1 Tax=Rhizobium sp. YIM 134829 TaxID=3390453 RepID=UPI003979533F